MTDNLTLQLSNCLFNSTRSAYPIKLLCLLYQNWFEKGLETTRAGGHKNAFQKCSELCLGFLFMLAIREKLIGDGNLRKILTTWK